MSFTDRLVDLALETILRFLTLQDIDNVLLVDTKLKELLEASPTKFYQSQSLFRRRKLQEIGIKVGSTVMSVAYSPDGKRIVSGSGDKTIRQWNAETGYQIGNPLTGHTQCVNSVAYSPDGRYIVSGSADDTVRQWNVETGEQIGASMTGHTKCVWSVAYSPDDRKGLRIVSESGDKTIRQWNAETGAQIGKPMIDSTYYVPHRVAYSPDGKRIVSESYKTICQFDAESGKHIGIQQTFNKDIFAYSPDKKRIVSTLLTNRTKLHQWNAKTGTRIGDILRGHTGWIFCVAYSPDGKCIVSGSDDRTIRIWHV